MIAPQEPLVMTLGEALSMLQQRGYRLVPPEEGTDSWGTTRIANWDAPDHEFDTWPEAVSDALGVPVVARDDAAELRALLNHPLLNKLMGELEDHSSGRWWGMAEEWMDLRDAALAVSEGEA